MKIELNVSELEMVTWDRRNVPKESCSAYNLLYSLTHTTIPPCLPLATPKAGCSMMRCYTLLDPQKFFCSGWWPLWMVANFGNLPCTIST